MSDADPNIPDGQDNDESQVDQELLDSFTVLQDAPEGDLSAVDWGRPDGEGGSEDEAGALGAVHTGSTSTYAEVLTNQPISVDAVDTDDEGTDIEAQAPVALPESGETTLARPDTESRDTGNAATEQDDLEFATATAAQLLNPTAATDASVSTAEADGTAGQQQATFEPPGGVVEEVPQQESAPAQPAAQPAASDSPQPAQRPAEQRTPEPDNEPPPESPPPVATPPQDGPPEPVDPPPAEDPPVPDEEPSVPEPPEPPPEDETPPPTPPVPQDDVPVAVDDSLSLNEDAATTFTADQLLGNDDFGDNGPGNGGAIVSVQGATHGMVALDENGDVVFTPDADYNGPAEFTYTIRDADGDTSTATVNLTVDPANDAPVAMDNAQAVNPDTPSVSGNLLTDDDGSGVDSDPDGDSLTVTSAGTHELTYGELVVEADGSYTFTPNEAALELGAGQSGIDTFTYAISDGEGGTSSASLTLTVQGGNNPPVVDTVLGDRTNADAQTVSLDVSGGFADIDSGDGLSFEATGLPPGLEISADGVISGTLDNSASQGGPGEDGSYEVTVTATDGSGAAVSQTFTWGISNPGPAAADDAGTLAEGAASVTGNLLGNDSDPDGDSLTVTSAGTHELTYGELVVEADGSYTFTPNEAALELGAGQSGVDTFTYAISDGEGGTDTATLTLTVPGPADAEPEPTPEPAPFEVSAVVGEASTDFGGIVGFEMARTNAPDGGQGKNTAGGEAKGKFFLEIQEDGEWVQVGEGYVPPDTAVRQGGVMSNDWQDVEVTLMDGRTLNSDSVFRIVPEDGGENIHVKSATIGGKTVPLVTQTGSGNGNLELNGGEGGGFWRDGGTNLHVDAEDTPYVKLNGANAELGFNLGEVGDYHGVEGAVTQELTVSVGGGSEGQNLTEVTISLGSEYAGAVLSLPDGGGPWTADADGNVTFGESDLDAIGDGTTMTLTYTGAELDDGDGLSVDLTISGDETANYLVGGTGNDVLTGAGGNDILDGGAGADELLGMGGDDLFMFGNGVMTDGSWVDVISGGTGFDTLDLTQMADGWTVYNGTGDAIVTAGDASGFVEHENMSGVVKVDGEDAATFEGIDKITW